MQKPWRGLSVLWVSASDPAEISSEISEHCNDPLYRFGQYKRSLTEAEKICWYLRPMIMLAVHTPASADSHDPALYLLKHLRSHWSRSYSCNGKIGFDKNRAKSAQFRNSPPAGRSQLVRRRLGSRLRGYTYDLPTYGSWHGSVNPRAFWGTYCVKRSLAVIRASLCRWAPLPLLVSVVLLVRVVKRSCSSSRDGTDTGPFPAAG
jgi:hypothetical protein